MDLAEKREVVFAKYLRTFDLDIALDTTDLTADEKTFLKKDEYLKARCTVALANEQETVISKIKTLGDSADKDSVRLSALIKYGELIAPNKFKQRVAVEISDYTVIGRKKEAIAQTIENSGS